MTGPGPAPRARRMLHSLRLLTVALALGAASAAAFSSPPASAARAPAASGELIAAAHSAVVDRTVVVHRPVSTPGTYHVTVSLSGPVRANRVRVSIAGSVYRVRTARRHRHARLSETVDVFSKALTVRAVGSRLRPQMRVLVRLIAPESTSNPAPAVAPSGTAAAGSTAAFGSTGSTGSTGSSGASDSTGTTPPSSPPATPSPSPSPSPAAPSAPPVQPTGVPGTWRLIFDDEFNSNSLDTGYWSYGLWGFNGPMSPPELECYEPSQVTEGGGELDLTAVKKTATCSTSSGNVTEPYESGMISTQNRFSYTYGFVEARAWLPGSGEISDWPGIWQAGYPPLPQGGELDVMEGLSGMACWHYHDPNGDRPGSCPAGTWTGGWHTFAADWEPGRVTWYYDGKDVGTDTQDIASSPEYLILTLAVDTVYGGPIQAPAALRLDYLRVWQH